MTSDWPPQVFWPYNRKVLSILCLFRCYLVIKLYPYIFIAGEHPTHSHLTVTITEDGTGTGKVGTTLYVAPELTEKASKSTYNQKVDMYTLGIILFEMIQPPFGTSMERAQTIMALRSSAIIIPESILMDSKYDKTVKVRELLATV